MSSPVPTSPSVSETSRPTRHLVDDGRRSGCEPDHVAVLDQQRVLHTHLLRQPLVGVQMAGLTMDRHGDLGPYPAIHLLKLVAAGMAGDMDEMVALGDHLDPGPDQLVVQVVERPLVAGDDLGAEDDGVVGLEPDARVLPGGDPGQGTARLALAAGAQIEHPCRGRRSASRSSRIGRDVLQVADLACRIDHAPHRASDHEQLAPRRAGGEHRRLQAGDVRREAGEDDAVPLRADQRGQAVTDLGLGTGGARREHVRAVAQHRQHAVLADQLEGVDVGAGADQGGRVELPVAGVQDAAEGGVEHERVGIGDRVGDVDEAAVQAADLERLAGLDDADRHVARRNRSRRASPAGRRR